jgi:acetyl-CoA carboxylase biotin carboxylase subunit
MNTRLQVEHPVTEMVTGIDLVKCQIEIAVGLALPFSQADIIPSGHSLQCRIYAEDPDKDFMPSPGTIVHFRPPSGGLGVRDDNGVYEGYEVPMEYDPLLSKLVTWGQTRTDAIHRMLRALSEYQIYGIKTTIPFFKRILLHPKFIEGDYNTHFISNLEKEEDKAHPENQIVALIAAGIKSYRDSKAGLRFRQHRKVSKWRLQGRFQNFTNRR